MHQELTIRNLRGLQELEIDSLAPVDLLIGRNGSGKSTVLEAVWLHTNPFGPDLALRADAFRGIPWRTIEGGATVPPWQHLFFDLRTSEPITITGRRDEKRWTLRLSEDRVVEPVTVEAPGLPYGTVSQSSAGPLPALKVEYLPTEGEGATTSITVLPNGALHVVPLPKPALVPAQLCYPSSVRDMRAVSEMLGHVIRQKRLDDVINAAKTVEGDLENVAVIPALQPPPHDPGRMAVYVDVGRREMIPAAALGDGFLTVLWYVCAILALGRGGVLLVDEIGSGVHYSILGRMWQAISDLARQEEVQIIATTHSKECLDAAAANVPQGALRVHRLSRGAGGLVRCVSLDSGELSAAAAAGLELR